MSISKEQALEVFHRRYPPETVHSFTITDTLPDGYSIPLPTLSWAKGSLYTKLLGDR